MINLRNLIYTNILDLTATDFSQWWLTLSNGETLVGDN